MPESEASPKDKSFATSDGKRIELSETASSSVTSGGRILSQSWQFITLAVVDYAADLFSYYLHKNQKCAQMTSQDRQILMSKAVTYLHVVQVIGGFFIFHQIRSGRIMTMSAIMAQQ